MNILRRSAVLLLCLWLAPVSVLAANSLQNQELIKKSGLEDQLKDLPAAMQAAIGTLRQQGMPVDEKFEKAWAEAVPAAYSSEKILSVIDKGLQKLLTADEKRFILAHYNSPLGRRITELEIKASSLELQAEKQAFAQKLMANPSAYSDRLALYQQIDKTAGVTTMSVETAMNVSLAVAIGMTSAAEGPKDVDTTAIRAAIEKQRFAMTQQIASMVVASLAYTYKDLKADDLRAYVKFLSTPQTQKFNAGVMKLMSEALASQAQEFGKQLATNLGRKGV